MTTKLRKAPENLDNLAIVSDYAQGTLSVQEIAEKHKTTEHNVSLITKRFWKSLTNMRESRALISYDSKDRVHALKELKHTDLINSDFLNLLSEDNTALLTDKESTYCWIYVHTGNAIEALQGSKLDAGLFKERKRDDRFSYDRAMNLRALYLNSKPNIAQYIKELRETRLIDADVGKARIQSELIDQLEYMKSSNDPRSKRDILRTIELLGKTVGAFTERIEIQQVNPANALDQLIEMAKSTYTEVTE